jgi:hypothetical protein
MRKAGRVVLAIGPTVEMARNALVARGLDPRLPGLELRYATCRRPPRGWSHGTPIVADTIGEWGLISDEAGLLADLVLACLASGRFRLLQDDEVRNMLGELA